MPELKVELPEPRRIKAKDVFLSYLLDHHEEEIIHLLKEPLVSSNVAVQISFIPLMQHHVEVAEALLSKPDRLLPVLCSAVVQAQKNFLQTVQLQLEKESPSQEEKAFLDAHGFSLETVTALSVKENVHPRLIGVPCPAETRVPRSADVGLLQCFSGTVVRATAPRLLRHTLLYTCDTCAHLIHVKADHDQYYTAHKPQRCSNPHLTCYSKNFSSAALPDAAHTADYQEVKLQELMSGGGAGGSIPQSVWVTLHHDLVDSCKPGDDVLVCGTVVRRWKPAVRDARPAIEVVIRANNITVRNKQEGNASIKPELEKEFEEFWKQHKHQPLIARDLILASVCPQMYGLYLVKLAVAVVLCGGVQRAGVGGSRVRGEPHLLLVGDPGTGKSQLLQWACSSGSRAVLTTGVGSTAAGLTVTAVREPGGDWGLEAGALVLADGGVCCIDEFSSVREADRAAIHEAMEQQTISVAKAGMVCKLNSRCSVVAATNPKGRYDPTEPLNLNVGVASPLLSRFDLIFVLLDTNNPSWDQLVSNYILSGGAMGRLPEEDPAKAAQGCLWKLDKMRAYFRYARRLQPRLSAAADAVLSRFYQMQRSSSSRDQSRTTIRLLESLVRLSQGHARLMLHGEVLLQDAVVAVALWEAAMAAPAVHAACERRQNASNAALHAGFPIDPTASYRHLAENLLQRLQLEKELQEELSRLDEEDRLSSAEHLAAILGESSHPSASPASTKEPVLTFRVPSTGAAHTSSTPTDAGGLRDVCAGTQARRPPSYLSCATQESRRRDLIEELEDVAPVIVGPSEGRASKKRGTKKKKKVSGIEKYFKNNKIERTKKQKTKLAGKKKREVFVISSEDESNADSSESDSDSASAPAKISQCNESLLAISPSKCVSLEGETTKSPAVLVPPGKSKSVFCSEELVSVDSNENVTVQSDNNSCEMVSSKPSSGISSSKLLSESADQQTPINNQKEESLSAASPVIIPKSLSNRIAAKRKKSNESPFCVNASIKKARIPKSAGQQSKCKNKVKNDVQGEVSETPKNLPDLKDPHQPRRKTKSGDDTSFKKCQISMDSRKEATSSPNKTISKSNRCTMDSSEHLQKERLNFTSINCDPTNSSVVLSGECGGDRTAKSAESDVVSAPNNAECDFDTATENRTQCDDVEVANSEERNNIFTLSQKARSFLKQYAFPNEKNFRKNKNSVVENGVTVEQASVCSALEGRLSGKLVSPCFEDPISLNSCDLESSVASTDLGANLGGPDASMDRVEIPSEFDAKPHTGSTSFSSPDKPSLKTQSSISSKLNRFAFVPKAPQGESSTNAGRNGTEEGHSEKVIQEDITSPNDHVRSLRTEEEPQVFLNNKDHVESSTIVEQESCSGENVHNEDLLKVQEGARPDVCPRKNFFGNKELSFETSDALACGPSLTKRLCFDLGAAAVSVKVDHKSNGSVRKSFEKFASSQDLDEDFDF